MPDVVQDGQVVSLAYTLKLANGEIIDYTEVDEPLEYLHGAENIIPGLERELTGLHTGDSKEVAVEPADGYGIYDPEDVEVIEREMLPKNMPVKLGARLLIYDEDGNESEATVREISAKNVTLDFNHPLAGQKLFFSVQVLGVRDATEEEREHGHVHGDEHFEELLDDEDDEDDDYEDYEDFEDDEDDDYDDLEDDEEVEDED
jgi:FKBP-type peptidyl-prolyl cis-trans isomerase SlyD